MIDKFRPSDSFEEIESAVSQIEALAGSGVALASHEDILEWLGVTERRRAYAASKWMTGRRTKEEKKNLLAADSHYRRALGAVASNVALNKYDQTGNMFEAQSDALDIIEPSTKNVETLVVEMQLGGSDIEQMKERIARDPRARFVAPLALHGTATVAAATTFIKIGEMSSSAFDLPTQSGVSVIVGGFVYRLARTAMRSLPRQFGELVKSQYNTSSKVYMPGKSVKRKGKVQAKHLAPEDLPKWYAESHLDVPINKMYKDMYSYKPSDRDEIAPMVRHVLDEVKESVFEHYDIDLEEDQKTWQQRMIGKLAFIE